MVRLLKSSLAGTAEAAGAFDRARLGPVVQENHSGIVRYVRLPESKHKYENKLSFQSTKSGNRNSAIQQLNIILPGRICSRTISPYHPGEPRRCRHIFGPNPPQIERRMKNNQIKDFREGGEEDEFKDEEMKR